MKVVVKVLGQEIFSILTGVRAEPKPEDVEKKWNQWAANKAAQGQQVGFGAQINDVTSGSTRWNPR